MIQYTRENPLRCFYAFAGYNSIVVSCMYHLFRKLFIEKENESQQLF